VSSKDDGGTLYSRDGMVPSYLIALYRYNQAQTPSAINEFLQTLKSIYFGRISNVSLTCCLPVHLASQAWWKTGYSYMHLCSFGGNAEAKRTFILYIKCLRACTVV